MRIGYLQHVPFEGLGAIAGWAAARGHETAAVRLFAGEPPPEPADFGMLVVLGGPMNVDDDDRYPFLTPEKRALGRALDAGTPVVGVCLGAQLLARVLGANVVRSPHEEIGWFPVRLTEAGGRSPLFAGVPTEFETFHWHGDAFETPAGAELLATSDGCPAQAFVAGNRVLGLQFHPEATPEAVASMVEHEGADLDRAGLPFVQPRETVLAPDRPYALNTRVLTTILDNFERGIR